MRGLTMANRAPHGTRQVRDIGDKLRELMADDKADNTVQKRVAEEGRDVPRTETAGETEMWATDSTDCKGSV